MVQPILVCLRKGTRQVGVKVRPLFYFISFLISNSTSAGNPLRRVHPSSYSGLFKQTGRGDFPSPCHLLSMPHMVTHRGGLIPPRRPLSMQCNATRDSPASSLLFHHGHLLLLQPNEEVPPSLSTQCNEEGCPLVTFLSIW